MDKLIHLALFFFTYGFVGWLLESLYALYVHKRFVNRGFLSGPICPMYGVGVCLIIWLLAPLKDSFVLFFLGAVVITSGVEFVTGWLLETIFNTRWWDYSEYKLNLMGYICLPFSLLWGVAATLVVYFLQPLTARWIDLIPGFLQPWIAGACTIVLLIDVVTSVVSALHLKERMKEMQTLLLQFADDLASDLKSASFVQERREDLLNLKSDLVERYESLRGRLPRRQRRFLTAFPKAKTTRFSEALADLRDQFLGRK